MKKWISLLVSGLCLFYGVSLTKAGNTLHIVTIPQAKTVRIGGFEKALYNPVPLSQYRLVSFLHEHRNTFPVLFDMMVGKTHTLNELAKRGFGTKGPVQYTYGDDGCLYLSRFPSRVPALYHCLKTKTFEKVTIDSKDLTDSPYSFTCYAGRRDLWDTSSISS